MNLFEIYLAVVFALWLQTHHPLSFFWLGALAVAAVVTRIITMGLRQLEKDRIARIKSGALYRPGAKADSP